MKTILLSILLIIFTACSDNENIKQTKTKNINNNLTADISDQGIYAMCVHCHGSDGNNRAFGRSQRIAGWDASRVEESMYAIINGTYDGPMAGIMRIKVQGLSDAEIKEVSIYVSKLK